MAHIEFFPGNAASLPISQSFDITSVVAERIGSFLCYVSFCTDGTMFVLYTQGALQPDGSTVPAIVSWQHFSGSDVLESASLNLPLQPFLDNMNGRNPSSTRAVNYLMGGDDSLTGSAARDVMQGLRGNDTLQGNGGADRLQGGTGDDVLVGGMGKDVLTGGTGADQFQFHSAAEGGDRIADFTSGVDHISLDQAAFGLPAALTEGLDFIAGPGAAATQTRATVLYDPTTGVLAIDADGTGSAPAVTLAVLTNHAALGLPDLLLI